MTNAKAATVSTAAPAPEAHPAPISSAAIAAAIPLHLVHQEKPVATRRTRTITHHERLVPGPGFPAHLVTAAIAEAEQDEKIHPAEIHCRMESGEHGAQLVVFYVQETTS